MGMDIYLEDSAVETKRKACRKRLKKCLALRDKAKDTRERARHQRKADEWYEKAYNARVGYFRVNYNDYSLSCWLMHNIDPKAKGDWGIEPFWSAVSGKDEPIITDTSFHRELLKTARRWYGKASKLKGKESFLMVTDYNKSDLESNRWIKKKVMLPPERTDDYIERLRELVEFAELAVETGSPIYVSA